MKKQRLLIIFLLLTYIASAQEKKITILSVQNADRSISLYAFNITMIDYSVKLTFKLIGYSPSGISNPAMVLATPGRTKVATLVPTATTGMSFGYSYISYPGASFRKKPNTDIMYLLPGTAGNTLGISQVSSLAERLGKEDQNNFTSTGFIFKLGDTICAARAGTVFQTHDEVREGETANQAFNHNRNRIAMMNKDGTISNYTLLAPVQLLVTEGDNVVPGQPLAVFNKESEKYTLMFSVYYVDEKKAIAEDIEVTGRHTLPYEYMPTNFYTSENEAGPLVLNKLYTSIRNNDIIGKELSKKEKKKLRLQ